MKLSLRRQRLSQRREILSLLSDGARIQIQHDFRQLQPRIDYISTALRLINSLRSNIGVIGSVAAVLMMRRPSTLFSWTRRGWIVWRLMRYLKYR